MNVINDDHFKKIFSKRLRHTMYIRNITQAELSRKSGVSQTCISRYVNGMRTPTGLHISKLAEALKCSVEYLTRE